MLTVSFFFLELRNSQMEETHRARYKGSSMTTLDAPGTSLFKSFYEGFIMYL